jgi:hypothetical protein
MNKIKTLSQIVAERMAARGAMVDNPAAGMELERRIERRLQNDPALAVVLFTFSTSIAQVLATFPPATHSEFIRQGVAQAIIEWEDANQEFNEQLKTTPIT